MGAITAAVPRAPAKRPVSWARRFQKLAPYLWVTPALLIYTVFKLVPMFAGFYIALLKWDGLEDPKFIGLQNFSRMLDDQDIGMALLHNVEYAFGTVIGKIVVSLFLALLLNQALRGRAIYRATLFMPVVMSFVVVGILWIWMYNMQFGILPMLLGPLSPDWLGDANVALGSLMLVDTWKWYGFHMVIFLAGLQTIPVELYEAARIDGASRWRQFTSVTLPLLQPVMLVNVTLSLMGAFNVFDIPYVMTEGEPSKSTLVMALHIYIQGFKFYKFGYSAALSIALFILVIVIAGIQIKLMSSDNTE